MFCDENLPSEWPLLTIWPERSPITKTANPTAEWIARQITEAFPCRERHIADDFRLAVLGRNAIDTDVDDNGARLDPVSAYHLRLADSREDDIPASAHGR
jgi:hypothetical protein